MPAELVELRGHIIDSLLLPKVLDVLVEAGAEYRIVDIEIGRTIDLLAPYCEELGIDPPELTGPPHPDIDAQIEAVLEIRPAVFSFTLGMPSRAVLAEMRRRDWLQRSGASGARSSPCSRFHRQNRLSFATRRSGTKTSAARWPLAISLRMRTRSRGVPFGR